MANCSARSSTASNELALGTSGAWTSRRFKGAFKAPLRKFDDFQQRHGAVGFPLAVVKKFGDDHAGNLAAPIAHYAFFSIFPFNQLRSVAMIGVTAGLFVVVVIEAGEPGGESLDGHLELGIEVDERA